MKYHLLTDTRPNRFFEVFNYLPDLPEGNLLFKKLPTISSDGAILDFGCSEGFTTKDISQIYRSQKIIGNDIQKEILPQKGGGNIEYILGDGMNIFSSNSFDIVFAMNNLYFQINNFSCINLHQKKKESRKRINSLSSLVKKEGYFIIVAESGIHDGITVIYSLGYAAIFHKLNPPHFELTSKFVDIQSCGDTETIKLIEDSLLN